MKLALDSFSQGEIEQDSMPLSQLNKPTLVAAHKALWFVMRARDYETIT